MRPSRNPGIEDEPQYRGDAAPDPSEFRAAVPPLSPDGGYTSIHQQAENSVWDEPGISMEHSGAPGAGAPSYSRHFARMRGGTAAATTWLVTLGIALLAGPWAILCSLFSTPNTLFAVLILVAFAPMVEEVMKIGLAAWVVECRPWLFGFPAQIILCGLAAGLAFGVIENLIYLNVYIRDPEPWLVAWRWTVCTMLHVTCSGLASVGLARAWKAASLHGTKPDMAIAFPWLTGAIVLHGGYNAFSLFLG